MHESVSCWSWRGRGCGPCGLWRDPWWVSHLGVWAGKPWGVPESCVYLCRSQAGLRVWESMCTPRSAPAACVPRGSLVACAKHKHVTRTLWIARTTCQHRAALARAERGCRAEGGCPQCPGAGPGAGRAGSWQERGSGLRGPGRAEVQEEGGGPRQDPGWRRPSPLQSPRWELGSLGRGAGWQKMGTP